VEQAEAEREAAKLNAEHPERDRFEWVAFPHKNGSWTLVKTPRRKRVDPLKATTQAKPKPPEPDDPRGPLRGVSGYG
jgi:hypothetical protein